MGNWERVEDPKHGGFGESGVRNEVNEGMMYLLKLLDINK